MVQREYIPTDENGKELLTYISDGFACAIFYADIAKYLQGLSPWHWHEEFEIFVVTKGSLSMFLGSEHYTIRENEGAFINSNVLHSMEVANGSTCELITILFSPEIFLGGKQTKIFRDMTKGIYGNAELAAFLYDSNFENYTQFTNIIKSIYNVYSQRQKFQELLICEYLAKFWRLFLINMTDNNQNKSIRKPVQESRVQNMIKYIRDNYASQICIADIAASVNISSRECTRCFNNILHTTPIKYLNEHRLSICASLLVTTDMPITEIAFKTGFNNASYFSKTFTDSMKISPSRFRRSLVE